MLSIITGKLFDVNVSSEYVETIIAKCIDNYTKLRVGNAEADEQYQTTIDARYVILYVRYSWPTWMMIVAQEMLTFRICLGLLDIFYWLHTWW